MPKLALTACCCCKHIKGTFWETLAPQACPDLALCPFLRGGGQRGVCATASDISQGCRHRRGAGAGVSHVPHACRGESGLLLEGLGSQSTTSPGLWTETSLQGWVVPQGNTGHTNVQCPTWGQSCTWSYSVTWAALGMSHMHASTRPGPVQWGRSQLLQLPMAVGKHTMKFPGPLQAVKLVQLTREGQRESEEQKTHPPQQPLPASSPTAWPADAAAGPGPGHNVPPSTPWSRGPHPAPGAGEAPWKQPCTAPVLQQQFHPTAWQGAWAERLCISIHRTWAEPAQSHLELTTL